MIKMNFMIFRILILFILILSCGQVSYILEPHEWNLNGDWEVLYIRFDDVIIDTTYLEILQSNNHVFFCKGLEIISTGIIQTDTIYCSDMLRVGISRIFIDDNNHMHSETPTLEILKMLSFIRQ
jgi:hypothetical protein